MHGRFDPPHNRFETRDPGLYFLAERDGDEFYQRVFVRHGDGLLTHRQRIDIVTGSGKMAQTYLYWLDGRLYQLHLTHLVEIDGWINSPGFRDGAADFARPVAAGCLDCHATYFEPVPDTFNSYRIDNYILGISCEQCHGPGSDHADYHRFHPDDPVARHITNPADLPAARVNDICSQCHSGPGDLRRPAFSFRPGDRIEHYREPPPENLRGGVHTDNQLIRLEKSACFQQSPQMSCATCHDPHRQERGDLALFSNRCMSCHEPALHPLAERVGEPLLTRNCIDCHMPQREDEATGMAGADAHRFPLLRDHRIAIYPDITRIILDQMQADP